MEKLLEVKDLHTSFKIPAGEVHSVNGVSFSLEKGKVLGIVGESGSGKSVTAYSIMQILDSNGSIKSGSVKFKGQELVGIPEKEMRKIRGSKVSIIFQDPMTSLNPVYTIKNQLSEAINLHTDYKDPKTKEKCLDLLKKYNVKDPEKHIKKYAYYRSLEMLKLVGINEPEKRLKQYPFEFSGGMLQRMMIAMSLVCEPDLLIADEPTTALDVTIQAQILELLKEIQAKIGMSIIIITHDLGVVAQICDDVCVMYAGRIVERGDVNEIFYNPQNEYTKGLMQSVPKLTNKKTALIPIEGNPVDVFALPKGCSFAPRCKECMKICLEKYPPEEVVNEKHYTSCFKFIYSLYEAKKISAEELKDIIDKAHENSIVFKDTKKGEK